VIYLAPIVFFYALAHMAVRSQELRLIAQSMAEVAMRLAEPETVARESIVTVGQAIRREVAAMATASSARSHAPRARNAGRQRGVRARTRLQRQRSADSRAVAGSRRPARYPGRPGRADSAMHQRRAPRSQRRYFPDQPACREQVNEASRRITHTLAEKGEHITRALQQSGDSMIGQLGERGGDLLERLETTSTTTTDAITKASDRLTATLNFKTDHIGDEFTEIAANLQHMMTVRLDRVADGSRRNRRRSST